ncbi:MAG: hypothetical protein LBQ96_05315 [Fusobacteriaceae bacterium]|jgi:hypothetical protein|nr:hypothetical protein [Fusobacteriaceae bacterium]
MKEIEEKLEEQLEEELHEFQREQEKIRNIVGQLGGSGRKQNRIVSIVFFLLIFALLIVGLGMRKTDLNLTLLIVLLLTLFKIVWMLFGMQKAYHFQFWILNTLEYRLNEADKRIKRVEALLKARDEKGNVHNFTV